MTTEDTENTENAIEELRHVSPARPRFKLQRISESRDPITAKIIAAAIEVHRQLGPGLFESTYEECLCWELAKNGVEFRRQVILPVIYKGVHLEQGFKADLIVERSTLVELKAVDAITGIHQSQLITYLRLSELRTGLILNFNSVVMRDGILRLVV